jgi:uncharacterized repeat protein (TIGR03803 family)
MLAGCGGSASTVAQGIPAEPLAHYLSQGAFRVLHSFSAYSDGAEPRGALIFDTNGALYGTTSEGGLDRCFEFNDRPCGTVFKLTPSGSGYSESIVYEFQGSDGATPLANLVFDTKGALYSTTLYGGPRKCFCGTVFKLTPSQSGYTENILFSFTGRNGYPFAGVLLGTNGAFYGTTDSPGAAFELTPSASGYSETILHRFRNKGHDRDGTYTGSDLIFGKGGALYGTAEGGGVASCPGGCGTVFKLTLPSHHVKVIHSFADSDGASPVAGLISDAKGALYGTTADGGSGACYAGCGTVFKLTPSALGYTESVLYSFTGSPDGSAPYGNLVFDKNGALHGTTRGGGVPSCDCGTIFKLTRSGSGYAESVMHSFSGNTDGASPYAGLIIDKQGALYGTASSGGSAGNGTVFELTP